MPEDRSVALCRRAYRWNRYIVDIPDCLRFLCLRRIDQIGVVEQAEDWREVLQIVAVLEVYAEKRAETWEEDI